MADNPFLVGAPSPEDWQKQQTSNPFLQGAPSPGEWNQKPAIRQEPVSKWERFAFTNFFDTQTKRRDAYAKQIGIELDPKDHNKYRMAGVPKDTPYDQMIDPKDFMDWQDATDVIGDAISGIGSGLGTAAGAAVGGTLGSTLPGPGTALGGLAGGAMGSAEGYQAVEGLKKLAGDWVLKTGKDMPLDQAELFQQKLIAGAIPVAGAVLKQGGIAAVKAWGNLRLNALKNIIREGGEMTKSVFNKLVQKPQLYTEEATQGGGKKLSEEFVKWFGKAPPEGATETEIRSFIDEVKRMGPKDFNDNTIAGQLLKPAKEEQQALLNALSQNRNADVSGSQLLSNIRGKISELEGARGEGTTAAGEEALNMLRKGRERITGLLKSKNPNIEYLEKQLADVRAANPHDVTNISKITKQLQSEIDNTKIDFGQARDQIDLLQGDVYATADRVKTSENGLVKKVIGETKGILDEVSNRPEMPRINGKSFADVNKDLSRKLSATQDMMTKTTPQKMINVAVKGHQVGAQDATKAIDNFDSAFGTNLKADWDSQALQAHLENIYESGMTLGERKAKQAQGLIDKTAGAAYDFALTGRPGDEVSKLSSTQQFLDRLNAPVPLSTQAAQAADQTMYSSPLVQEALRAWENPQQSTTQDDIQAYLQKLREEEGQ